MLHTGMGAMPESPAPGGDMPLPRDGDDARQHTAEGAKDAGYALSDLVASLAAIGRSVQEEFDPERLLDQLSSRLQRRGLGRQSRLRRDHRRWPHTGPLPHAPGDARGLLAPRRPDGPIFVEGPVSTPGPPWRPGPGDPGGAGVVKGPMRALRLPQPRVTRSPEA